MANFKQQTIETKHPLSDSMGNQFTLVYVGPNDFHGADQPFAICWNGHIQDYFSAEDIEAILSEGTLRTTPKGNTRLVINW